MSKSVFKGEVPESLYVVTYGELWRLFSSHGQAMRWYALKVNEGLKSSVFQYSESTVIARVE
jgi:hypothetical protein